MICLCPEGRMDRQSKSCNCSCLLLAALVITTSASFQGSSLGNLTASGSSILQATFNKPGTTRAWNEHRYVLFAPKPAHTEHICKTVHLKPVPFCNKILLISIMNCCFLCIFFYVIQLICFSLPMLHMSAELQNQTL